MNNSLINIFSQINNYKKLKYNPLILILFIISQFIYFLWYYFSFHNIYSTDEIKKTSVKTLFIKYFIFMLPIYLYIIWSIYIIKLKN
jgi:hypothetical protein